MTHALVLLGVLRHFDIQHFADDPFATPQHFDTLTFLTDRHFDILTFCHPDIMLPNTFSHHFFYSTGVKVVGNTTVGQLGAV